MDASVLLAASDAGNSGWLVAAIISFPATLTVLLTYRKANSASTNAKEASQHASEANAAVNHRVNGRTVSQDVQDMHVELREIHKEFLWLSRAFGRHLREGHATHDDKD